MVSLSRAGYPYVIGELVLGFGPSEFAVGKGRLSRQVQPTS